ncbi:hypothetical protein M3Y97_00368400 [Aphelenchoides bicaudatus]|nr:hypothetical protein M3Y97_00368400 [Aphelenchoides bicaudatus]
MTGDREELENGRMFNELCSLNSNRSQRPQISGRIRPKQPTTLYEQFKQSNFDEPQSKRVSASARTQNDAKQLVTKEEAQKLRDSVLKSTRPLNPYFDRSESSSPTSRSSPSSSNKSATNYTTTTYLNNDKKVDPPKKSTPEVRSIPIIRTKVQNNQPTSKLPSELRNNHKSTPQQTKPKHRDFVYVDTFEDTTPTSGLHTLEQLEAENRRRVARVEQTSSDEFASPSTYYFSDECSSTAERNEESPKYASYTHSSLPACAECRLPIKDMILQAIGKSFHPECFKCFECQKSLDGVPFAVNDNEQVFCMNDYERIYVPICARCQLPIKPSNAYGQIVRVVAMDNEYHIACYSCASCGLQLTNEENRRCYPLNGTLLCRTCNFKWQRMGGPLSPLTDL